MAINFKRRGLWKTFVSLIRAKLIVPMLRSKNPPEIIARGSLVGMAWAMTPLVGIQMYLVFVTWLFTRRFFKWDFNLPVGLAWTWVTNVFTVPPIYYGFYVTGRLMMGNFADRTTYAKFYNLLKTVIEEDGIVEGLKALFAVLVKDWGFAMALGSIPWAIIGSWAAYRWTLWYMRRRRATLAKRLESRQKRLEKKIENTQKKFEQKVEKVEQKIEVSQQKFENKQKKLEEKLEKTIAAMEEINNEKKQDGAGE